MLLLMVVVGSLGFDFDFVVFVVSEDIFFCFVVFFFLEEEEDCGGGGGNRDVPHRVSSHDANV